jgi:hypothetical protein
MVRVAAKWTKILFHTHLNTRAKPSRVFEDFGCKEKHSVLGLAFVILLGLSYAENQFFFGILGDVLQNELLAVGMLFLHNIIVVSLILIGMTFYVNLVVLNFFQTREAG